MTQNILCMSDEESEMFFEVNNAIKFISESNTIEGIHRSPKKGEIKEYLRFMALEAITIEELQRFVSVYQPNAKLRDNVGMNVRVGNYRPMAGGPAVKAELEHMLKHLEAKYHNNPHKVHKEYETLHPFTDCNGRSGRMLWRWMMRDKPLAPLGFLQTWYYQSLEEGR